MEKKTLNSTTTAFIFDEIEDYRTCVFLIERQSRLFLLDTFCGTESMSGVQTHLSTLNPGRQLFVINSHFHWDHVWGNASFKTAPIIAHDLCYDELDANWELQVENNKQHISGCIEKVLPSLTFEGSLSFREEGLEIFHSPGHTRDCISIFDRHERALYVGDNLEKPIIYVEDPDIDTYLKTLRHYLTFSADSIHASHSLDLDNSDLLDTIDYLEKLKNDAPVEFDSEYARQIHADNRALLRSG